MLYDGTQEEKDEDVTKKTWKDADRTAADRTTGKYIGMTAEE